MRDFIATIGLLGLITLIFAACIWVGQGLEDRKLKPGIYLITEDDIVWGDHLSHQAILEDKNNKPLRILKGR